jgi:hypothetical protein
MAAAPEPGQPGPVEEVGGEAPAFRLGTLDSPVGPAEGGQAGGGVTEAGVCSGFQGGQPCQPAGADVAAGAILGLLEQSERGRRVTGVGRDQAPGRQRPGRQVRRAGVVGGLHGDREVGTGLGLVAEVER